MRKAALAGLVGIIQAECLDVDLFRGEPTCASPDRVIGGQVLAQAMYASNCTVEGNFVLHALHSNFLLQGDPNHPLFYRVERLRDGRSFRTRRVEAVQHGRVICHVTLSYQIPEQGLEHQGEMPTGMLSPEALMSDRERFASMLGENGYDWPIEFCQVDPVSLDRPERAPASSHVWFRACDEVVGGLDKHQELLAYASDHMLLLTALRPHAVNPWVNPMHLATLDHAIWFHRPFRMDDWLLHEMHSQSAAAGRALVFGKIFDRSGQLVASVAQEGLVRLSEPPEA